MLAANSSQQILEPIHYLEEKPLKIVEKLKSVRRKISKRDGTKKKTISKKRKPRTVRSRTMQIEKNIKLELEYSSGESGECDKMKKLANDPLFMPQREKVIFERNKGKFKAHVEDGEETEIYNESDEDKDYCIEDDEEFKLDQFESEDDHDADDDDRPLILLTERSSSKTYKKKTPRLYNCLPTCKHKCTTKYDKQKRLDIFDYYWHLNELDKVKFIRKHIRKPVVRRLRSKKLRNNCCYFLKYYKTVRSGDSKTITENNNNNSDNDDDEDLTKVCRKFFDGTLNISERQIKEAIKNYELKSEKIAITKNKETMKLGEENFKEIQQPQQYLDPETGDLTATKPRKKTKRRKRGEPPPERFPKPINCAIRCKFKCHEKFSEVERKQICDVFWSLDFKRRKDFILSRIETTDVKTPITPEFRKTNRPTRAYQAKFYLRSGLKSENIRVCKHFILNTLCTNRWFIENAIEFADKTTGAYTGTDRRRTHSVHNKISEERRQTIRDDINSYPCWLPNKKSKSKYLHYNLSIIKMYDAYKKKCLAVEQKYVSKKYYYRVFHEDFQLLFLKNPHPKKGPGFLLSNPHISNYTGQEIGGTWMDYKGNELDMRIRNPAKRLNALHQDFVTDVCPPENLHSNTEYFGHKSLSINEMSIKFKTNQSTAPVGTARDHLTNNGV